MQDKIDEYFETQVGIEVQKDLKGKPVFDIKGKPIHKLKVPTINGLALHLGFCGRQGLYDYSLKPQFAYTIKKAIATLEAFVETQILTGANPAGPIFWLKNHKWTDKREEESQRADIADSARREIEDLKRQISNPPPPRDINKLVAEENEGADNAK